MNTRIKKLLISLAVIAINIVFALVITGLAFLERGYKGIGGEWVLIILLGIGSVNFLIELAKAREVQK